MMRHPEGWEVLTLLTSTVLKRTEEEGWEVSTVLQMNKLVESASDRCNKATVRVNVGRRQSLAAFSMQNIGGQKRSGGGRPMLLTLMLCVMGRMRLIDEGGLLVLQPMGRREQILAGGSSTERNS